MATIYVTEYERLAGDYTGQAVPAPKAPAIARQSMAIGGASTALPNAFGGTTHFIIIHSDAICSITIGPSPVAVTSADRMGAGETRFYGVNPGDNLAVIANS